MISAVRDDAGASPTSSSSTPTVSPAGWRGCLHVELVGRRVHETLPAFPPELFERFVERRRDRHRAAHADRPALAARQRSASTASSSRPRAWATGCSSSTRTSARALARAPPSAATAPCSRRPRTGCRSPTATTTSSTSTRRGGGWSGSASTRTSPGGASVISRPRGRASACCARALAGARRDGVWRAISRACTATGTRSRCRR